MITPILLSIAVSIFIVIGQVLWKLGIGNRILNFSNFPEILKSPFFIIGIVLYGFATILWLYMLSKYKYHYIYPLIIGLSVIFSLLVSRLVLNEEVSWISWLGVLIICFGIIIITVGSKLL